jgi:hypothetical protein
MCASASVCGGGGGGSKGTTTHSFNSCLCKRVKNLVPKSKIVDRQDSITLNRLVHGLLALRKPVGFDACLCTQWLVELPVESRVRVGTKVELMQQCELGWGRVLESVQVEPECVLKSRCVYARMHVC